MKHKIILKKIINFLKKEHVYIPYIKNLKNGKVFRLRYATINEKDESLWLTETIKKELEALIIEAFSWLDSDENKNNSWIIIDRKWKKIIDELFCN